MIDIDLIIFDVDGTLIDSINDIVGAIKVTLKKMGFREKPPGEITSYIGKGMVELIRKSIGEENSGRLNEGMDIFKDYYIKHSADKTRPYPGVVEILEHFKDKKKAIVSNRDKKFAELTLDLLGLGKYFEEVVGGDDVTCSKPMGCPLVNVMGKFGVDKKRTIMVGDMDLDIYAGKDAGVWTCGVTYGIGQKDDLIKAQPDYLIDDILKLKEIIK